MTASDFLRLVSLTFTAVLAGACSGDGVGTQGAPAAPDPAAEMPVAQVLKPLPGIDIDEILGAMESPGHWIDVTHAGEIFIGSLTGNVFRWYEDWLDTEEAAQVERTEEP